MGEEIKYKAELKNKLVTELEEAGFKMFIDAQYLLTFIPGVEQEIIEKTKIIADRKAEIATLEADPEAHTKNNREIIAFKKKQLEDDEAYLESLPRKIENTKKESEVYMEKAIQYQKKAAFVRGL